LNNVNSVHRKARIWFLAQGDRIALVHLFVVAVFWLSHDCRAEKPVIETGYGRRSRSNYASSVNGTLVFQNLLEQRGIKVDHSKKLSPRIDRYDNIVWFNDDFNAPDQEAIDRLEQWLSEGFDRRLIYVGRDYDAAVAYWEIMLASASEEQKIELQRMLAQELTRHEMQRNAESRRMDCDWFEIEVRNERKPARIIGKLCDGIDVDQVDLRLGSRLVPKLSTGGFGSNEPISDRDIYLLKTDDVPFVFSFWRYEWNGGTIVVVTNGSFLLNLPLTNEANRQLADALTDNFITDQRVLFLENRGPIEISNTDSSGHTQWGWITEPPLRQIVPHLLFWCLVFCFVCFPIFGRPRRMEKPATTHFRDHIVALGQLLGRAHLDRDCEQWIEQYHRRAGQPTQNRSNPP